MGTIHATNNREVRQAILEYGRTHADFTVKELSDLFGVGPRDTVYGGMTVNHILNYMERRYGEAEKVTDPGDPLGFTERGGYHLWRLTPIGLQGGNWEKKYKFERKPVQPRAKRRGKVERALRATPKPKLKPSEKQHVHEEMAVLTVAAQEPVTFITEKKFNEFMERVTILMEMLEDRDRTIRAHEHYKEEMAKELDQIRGSQGDLAKENQRLREVVTGLQDQVLKAQQSSKAWEKRFKDKEHRMLEEVEQQAVTNLLSSGQFPQLKTFLDATEKAYQQKHHPASKKQPAKV